MYDDMGLTIDAKTGQPVQRNLDALTQGTPQASPALSFDRPQQQAYQQASPDIGGQFGLLLMDLLRQQQQLGTRPFAEQGFNAQEEQVRRLGQQTSPELIGASPQIQQQARSAATGALEPTIKGAQEGQQTFGESIKSLGSGIESARGFLQDYETQQDKQRDDARSVIKDAITTFGSRAIDIMDKKMWKLAGYDEEAINNVTKSLKEQEIEQKLQIANQNAALRASTGGLTAAQVNQTVNQIAGAFDNEPIVKAYNISQEGLQTIKSIGVNTKSPADDIAFIYAFAKIMDPNSVVREGEYNTIQRYAQTWADNFGFKAQRIFSNTNFLSTDAKQKMLNSLQAKANAIGTQYNNLYKEYQRQMDDARAGTPRTLTQYQGAFPETQPIKTPTTDTGGVPQGNAANTPVGGTVKIGNTLYRRTSQDNFEPVGSAL